MPNALFFSGDWESPPPPTYPEESESYLVKLARHGYVWFVSFAHHWLLSL